VAAQWQQSGIALADHAAQQRQIGDGLHIVDAVFVVGNAHAPGKHSVFRFGIGSGNLFDLGLFDTAGSDDG